MEGLDSSYETKNLRLRRVSDRHKEHRISTDRRFPCKWITYEVGIPTSCSGTRCGYDGVLQLVLLNLFAPSILLVWEDV